MDAHASFSNPRPERVYAPRNTCRLRVIRRDQHLSSGLADSSEPGVKLPRSQGASRNRRLARDFERYATTVAAFIRLAMIRIMFRRLVANASP